jgi:hypothetical protein
MTAACAALAVLLPTEASKRAECWITNDDRVSERRLFSTSVERFVQM